jgi:hypothetical protein
MNHLTMSILLFIILFTCVHMYKPVLIYNTDGSLRQFGIGYRKKTVVPLWLVTLLLAILTFSVSMYIIP